MSARIEPGGDPGNKRAPASSTLDEALRGSSRQHDSSIITHRPILRLRCKDCGVRTAWDSLHTGSCAACSPALDGGVR